MGYGFKNVYENQITFTTKFTTGGTVASEDYNSHAWGEDCTWGFGEVDTNDYTYDINASYLGDGSFNVVLSSLWGDFYIDKSVLEIEYNPVGSSANSAPVPEPATMLLLGSGLIGVSFVGRKKFFKR